LPDRNNDNQILIVSDFDGTISRQDIGNRLFHHFSDGRSDEPVQRWIRNEIDSKECLLAEAGLMRPITHEEFDEYLEGHEIDPGFPGLVEMCDDENYSLAIVSDGLDLYIKPVLSRYGLEHLPVYANRANLENGRLQLEFPYYADSCGRCANCKGSRIKYLKRPGQIVVYIGDGKSDLCAIDQADLIFAKKYLARHLREHNIPFEEYATFADVAASFHNGIGDMLTQNRARRNAK
jgi:2,3-diketo-5-methylthio-1-phosphopentane phosphatase